MLTSKQLKDIRKEARPLIEQQIELAVKIAGFRELVSSHGGDWGQLKALIKAQIQDENDDEGDGKRVRKILDRADYANAYADMLGLAKMNEKNSFADDEDDDPDDGETVQIEQSAQIVQSQPATDPKQSVAAVTVPPDGEGEEGGSAGTSAALLATPSTEEQTEQVAGQIGNALGQDRESGVTTQPVDTNTREGAPATEGDDAPPASSVVQFTGKKQWKHADKPHPDCLNGTVCGGFSNLGLCPQCKEAAAKGQVA